MTCVKFHERFTSADVDRVVGRGLGWEDLVERALEPDAEQRTGLKDQLATRAVTATACCAVRERAERRAACVPQKAEPPEPWSPTKVLLRFVDAAGDFNRSCDGVRDGVSSLLGRMERCSERDRLELLGQLEGALRVANVGYVRLRSQPTLARFVADEFDRPPPAALVWPAYGALAQLPLIGAARFGCRVRLSGPSIGRQLRGWRDAFLAIQGREQPVIHVRDISQGGSFDARGA